MAGLLRVEGAADAVDHVGAGEPRRLVDDEPAVERTAARFAAGHGGRGPGTARGRREATGCQCGSIPARLPCSGGARASDCRSAPTSAVRCDRCILVSRPLPPEKEANGRDRDLHPALVPVLRPRHQSVQPARAWRSARSTRRTARPTREESIRRSGGRTTVPQIFIDGRHIGGCDDLVALDGPASSIRCCMQVNALCCYCAAWHSLATSARVGHLR